MLLPPAATLGTSAPVRAQCRKQLGGSALAQTFKQLGNQSPDLDDAALLATAFDCTQELIGKGLLASGHDRSDGGLVVTLLEMAFAGNCGFCVKLDSVAPAAALASLFAEELGRCARALTAAARAPSSGRPAPFELLTAPQSPFRRLRERTLLAPAPPSSRPLPSAILPRRLDPRGGARG